MNKKETRLCWFCRHFYWSNAEPGYSEYTPGSDFSMYCGKGHWDFDSYKTTSEEFRENINMAVQCKDFVLLDALKTLS